MDVRHLTTDLAFDSYSYSLFEQLAKLAPTEVLEIDLGNGREWLTTRLYLFSALLERRRDVRCVALLRTDGDRVRQVLGSASPEALCKSLAVEEPWLEQTYVAAHDEVLRTLGAAGLNLHTNVLAAQHLARAFVRNNQRFSMPERWSQRVARV